MANEPDPRSSPPHQETMTIDELVAMSELFIARAEAPHLHPSGAASYAACSEACTNLARLKLELEMST